MSGRRRSDEPRRRKSDQRGRRKPDDALPPVSGRFREGESGNPKGRPRGAKDKIPRGLKSQVVGMVYQEFHRKISIIENGEQSQTEMGRAAIRQLGMSAIKGKGNSAQKFIEMGAKAEEEIEERRLGLFEIALSHQERWRALWAEDDAAGRPRRMPPCLNPDDIELDYSTLEITLNGPLTPEEKSLSDEVSADIRRVHGQLFLTRESLKRARSPQRKAALEEAIQKIDKEYDQLAAVWWTVRGPRVFNRRPDSD